MAGFRIIPSAAPIAPARKAKKDGDYLAFIHRLPCCITGVYGVQAAHVSFANQWYGHFGRAKGTKAPDLFALPLSPALHAAQHSGSETDFWIDQAINPHELGVTLWAIYSAYDEDDAEHLCTQRIHAGIANGRYLRGDD